MERFDRIAGGLFGLLVGDALGVPYEFYPAEELPPYEQIEMTPPVGFRRTYPHVPDGTWSDDGAQALCLLSSLLSCGRFELEDFSQQLLRWYKGGHWAVDELVFDVGTQTAEALYTYEKGTPAEKCGMIRPNGKGNGALMRVLPLALWHMGSDLALVEDAHRQCLITHGHICNQVCCALYCLTARHLLNGTAFAAARDSAIATIRTLYLKTPDYLQELEECVLPNGAWRGNGSGYVVDCLQSSFMILERTTSYEEAVKQAVKLGDDTDTTACVTGGLAGILYGVKGIPERWMNALRRRKAVRLFLEHMMDDKKEVDRWQPM